MTTSTYTYGVNLPPQTLKAINRISLPENHKDLKDSFFSGTSLFKDYAANDPRGLSVLYLFLNWLDETKRQYEERGIPEQFFLDSMKDITIWCDDYLAKYNEPGFKEWPWVAHSLRMNVIRIGRLQFQPSQLAEDVMLNGETFPTGTRILEIHIPAGEPLTLEDVLESINQAPGFFKTYFGVEYSLFHCHSWLLSPDLCKLLPKNSRIILFQNLFTIYKTDNCIRQAEERVFGFCSDNPIEYPENTSLQRTLKQYLLAGHTVPMGAGIRKVN